MENNKTTTALSPQCEDLQLCYRYRKSSFFLEAVVVTLTVFDIFLVIATLATNGIFLLSLYLFKNLRRSSNYLLLNLAVANAIFGTSSFSVCAVFQLRFIGCKLDMCFFQDMFVYLAGTGLSLGLSCFTLITIERYFCIFYALRWQAVLTNVRVLVLVVIIWLICVATFSSLYIYSLWGAFYTTYVISLVINVLVLLIINGKILKEIRRHENRIAQDSQGPNAEELRKAREKKRAKTIMLMLALVFLCYGPTIVLVLATKIPSVDQVQLQFGWMACRTLSLSHSAFAILVYGLRTREIRNAYKSIIDKMRCL